MIGFEYSLHVFLNGFSARDLAEPLPSFDANAAKAEIVSELSKSQVPVVGIREAGYLKGWWALEDLAESSESLPLRPFDKSSVMADTASLDQVVQRLNASPYFFIEHYGQVSGFVTRADIQKPPMRMWLFGLITISELRVTRMIDEVCPNDSWREHLAPSRLRKADELQEVRRARGQNVPLVECLQFADKGRIVSREEKLRQLTRFPSQTQVQKFVDALQDLRNNLAHSNDISGDWKAILDLATNLHRIVLGPEAAEQSPPGDVDPRQLPPASVEQS